MKKHFTFYIFAIGAVFVSAGAVFVSTRTSSTNSESTTYKNYDNPPKYATIDLHVDSFEKKLRLHIDGNHDSTRIIKFDINQNSIVFWLDRGDIFRDFGIQDDNLFLSSDLWRNKIVYDSTANMLKMNFPKKDTVVTVPASLALKIFATD